MNKLLCYGLILGFVLSGLSGCSKKQLIPSIIAGTGAVLVTSGTIYRVTLPEKDSDGLFGRQPEQKATTASLLMGGLALIAVGIIWSATTTDCERDEDCWSGDRCEPSSKTCVPRPAETTEPPETQARFSLPLPESVAGAQLRSRFQLNIDGARTFF